MDSKMYECLRHSVGSVLLASLVLKRWSTAHQRPDVVLGLGTETGFHQLTLKEYQQFSAKFHQDLFSVTIHSSVAARNVPGGTAPEQVEKAIATAKQLLEGTHVP